MPRYETTGSGSHAIRFRRALWCVTLMVAGFGLPALAVKPGNKGARSTASVTVSLEIHPSVKVRLINRSNPVSNAVATPAPSLEPSAVPDGFENTLCLDVRDMRTLTFFVVTQGADGTVVAPVANWSYADVPMDSGVDKARCPVPVSLRLADVAPAGNGDLTLLVSPE